MPFLLISSQNLWLLLAGIILLVLVGWLVARNRNTILEKENKFNQEQAAFKLKIAETELMALRAQMNPHFIFNSLTSIENFMMNNDKKEASEYFSKFGSLMRSILDSSRNEWVPFEKDIKAIRLFVELEQLRFENKFFYQEETDPLLYEEDILVPPLLIQPFVENAICHGLVNIEKTGLRLVVSAILKDDYLFYVIEDNGIGREKAGEYKVSGHTSMGVKISHERLVIINQMQQSDNEIVITDLYSPSGEPEGTRVEIRIKVN